MLYEEDERGVCIIIIYIDNMLIIGKEEAIDAAIKGLQGHFQVKDPTSLEDYKMCKVMIARNPGWGNQQFLRVGETIWRESYKEENDYYTWNTRVYWWKGG